ncbi:DUF1488 family protein [Paraburkholderia sp. BL6669N2]|uniref:DUF1488 family protein n=1 Tax=Paraburkholderia sp. BL6669N2 TaxID=1938807 RepID=UPI000E240E4C|nr:DUF1488 family protein [Paraburkholderia sp. BL6669N2]
MSRHVKEVSDHAAAVSPDGRAEVFTLSVCGRKVEGAVARDALEQHFWLPRGADAARTLRTFENGRSRIVALAQRKLLARPHESLWLGLNDFLTR